ncbi:MAG: SMC-Scp complex subunit ScpB [Bacilli bacterium]|jgi:segregation and condensation protein B|nr:SMC-Scp complex subunit ScpB [Bacilli bacterium]
MHKIAILEGLLFVMGDEGLSFEQIGDILNIPINEVKTLVTELKKTYDGDDRGLTVNFLGNALKLTTKEEHQAYYQKLIEVDENNLSQAALETLAIIAYNEPVVRTQIDEIRGVNSSQMVRKLVAKGLIKEIGRSDLPGRPIIYRTTNDFLDYFGIASKDELPPLKELTAKEKDDVDLYNSVYREE